MGVMTDSVEAQSNSETCDNMLRPCAGGMPESLKNEPFDPSSWYIAQVKRHNELVCRKILNSPDRFPYKVEAYVAAQQELVYRANRTRHIKERVVIAGKIFVTSRIPLPLPLPMASPPLPGCPTGRSSVFVTSSPLPTVPSNTPTAFPVPTTRSRSSPDPSTACVVQSRPFQAANLSLSSSTPLAPFLSASLSRTLPNSPNKQTIQ